MGAGAGDFGTGGLESGTSGGSSATGGASGDGAAAGGMNGGVPATGGTGSGGGTVTGAGGGSANQLSGYARNPIVSHIYTADPSAHVFGDRVYVYTSHDEDDQESYDMIDYHVFSSDDLVNWQDHGVILDKSIVPWVDYLYAPDVCYSETTEKYYLYFPNWAGSIGVAVSDSPVGPFTDPLGEALVDRSLPGVGDEVDWVFDPTCFIDDDGQAYLYFGGGMPDTGDNARVVRLNEDMISLKDTSASTIVAPDFFEAAYVHKRNGKYYFSYSTSFADHPQTIDYMMSDSPTTGFVYAGVALQQPADNMDDNNHHSFIDFKGKSYVFYHNRVLSLREGKSLYQRSITLDNLSYASDGTINTVAAAQGRVAQVKAGDALARWEAETIADQRGVETDFAQDGGQRVGVMVTQIEDGDWLGYSQMDFGGGATSFQARVASTASAGANIEIYLDGCNEFTEVPGTMIASCVVTPTGGWQSWADLSCTIPETSGIHDLCLQFSGGSGELVNLDHFLFN